MTKEEKALNAAKKLKEAIIELENPDFTVDYFRIQSMSDLDWLIGNLELIVGEQKAA